MEADTIIRAHDTSNADEPLFLYFPIQSVHSPKQATAACMSEFDGIITDGSDRKTMAGMLKCLDDAVGVVINTLFQTKLPLPLKGNKSTYEIYKQTVCSGYKIKTNVTCQNIKS